MTSRRINGTAVFEVLRGGTRTACEIASELGTYSLAMNSSDRGDSYAGLTTNRICGVTVGQVSAHSIFGERYNDAPIPDYLELNRPAMDIVLGDSPGDRISVNFVTGVMVFCRHSDLQHQFQRIVA